MLTAAERERLAAHFEGDGDARERNGVVVWLSRSPEARAYAESLAADSRRLQSLACVAAPASLVPAVASRLMVLRPAPVVPSARGATWERWLPMSVVAAALVLGVWIGKPAAVTNPDSAPGAVRVAVRPPVQPTPVAVVPSQPTPADNPPTTPVLIASIPPADGPPSDPSPRVAPDVLTATSPPAVELVQVERPLLPKLVAAADLTKPAQVQQLATVLGQVDNPRIELTASDIAAAFDRLQQTATSHHLRLWVDASLLEAHRRKIKVPFGLFTDELSPADATKWLGDFATPDRKKQRGFEQLVLVAMSSSDRVSLSAVFGTDPTAGRTKRPAGIDRSRPLADTTRDQLRNIEPDSATNRGDRWVAVYALPGNRTTGAVSRELRHFLESRKDRSASHSPVSIVVQPLPN